MRTYLFVLLVTASHAAQCDESSSLCTRPDDETSLMQLNKKVAHGAQRLLMNTSAQPRKGDMIMIDEARKLNHFVMVDKGFESIDYSPTTLKNCKNRLEKCGLEDWETLATILCTEDARIQPGRNAKDAFKAVLMQWGDCFKDTPVEKLNFYLMVMDEITLDFSPDLDKEKKGKDRPELGPLRMGAWGATEELLKMEEPVATGIEPILSKWKTSGDVNDPSGFLMDALQKPGEFSQLYMNVVIQGMRKLGMTDEEIQNLPAQYHGFRVKSEHFSDSRHEHLAQDAVEKAATEAFGKNLLPAATITSGSRWDAWMHSDKSYNSAEAAIYAADSVAPAHIDICYGHQAFAQHHKGKVAMHSWEVGARSSYVAPKFQNFFGKRDLDISYVHLDEVEKPGLFGEKFIGNPHTKYEGMVYPASITTQGHPEVPLVYDIAMVASCTLWEFFYENDNPPRPSNYCRDTYNFCSGGAFVHESVDAVSKCLAVNKNDGWKGPDAPLADGQHASGDPNVNNGDGVPYTGDEENHPQINVVTTAFSYERACTQCFGAVQWNHLSLLASGIDQSEKCRVGDLGKRLAAKVKKVQTSASENQASLNDATALLHTSLQCSAKQNNPFLSICTEFQTLLDKTRTWNTARTAATKETPSQLYYSDPSAEEPTPISSDNAFHKLNALMWAMVSRLNQEDNPCFTDTLADILPDARLVAELWVRDVVTANLGADWSKCKTMTGECPKGMVKKADETDCVTLEDSCSPVACCTQQEAYINKRLQKSYTSHGDIEEETTKDKLDEALDHLEQQS